MTPRTAPAVAPRASFAPPRIVLESRPDGSRLLRSLDPLLPGPTSLVHAFRDGARSHPDRLLVAGRDGDAWRRGTWGEARLVVDRLAQGIITRGLADRPVIVLSKNSPEHLLLTPAAWTAGAPIVPVSVAYSLQSADHLKLQAMVELVSPGVVFAQDGTYAAALAAVGAGRTVVSPTELDGAFLLADLEEEPTGEVDARCAAVTGTDLAKILFTSGRPGRRRGCSTRTGSWSPTSRMAVPARRATGPVGLAAVEPHLRRQTTTPGSCSRTAARSGSTMANRCQV